MFTLSDCRTKPMFKLLLVPHIPWSVPQISPGGGGGSPLYKLYRYVPSHRLRFLCRFGLKTSIHFAHFGLELGMVFSELRKCMNVFIVSIPNE